jgi:hypothetical protein
MKKNRVLSERRIESSVAKKAVELGYLTYKFTSPSNRGVPDRIFINKKGDIFFIEFKSLSGKVSPLQKMVFSKLLARKAVVYLVNNIQSGVDILKNNIDKISGTATFESLYVPENT